MLISTICKLPRPYPGILTIPQGWTFLACRCDPRRTIISTPDQIRVRPSQQVIVVGNEFWARGLQRWNGALLTDIFRWAREQHPTARLIYNDYGAWNRIKWKGVPGFPGIVDYWAKERDRGCPITGIGVQAHHGLGDWDGGVALDRVLRRINEVGLEPHVTEATVWVHFKSQPTDRDKAWQKQAEIYGEMWQIARAHDCVQFGFTAPWDADPWCWDSTYAPIEEMGIFALDGTPKPAYYRLVALGMEPWYGGTSGSALQ